MTDTRVRGLVIVPEADETGPLSFCPVDSTEHKCLSEAINLGIGILKKPIGRRALRKLGALCVSGWECNGDYRFAGQVALMEYYVDKFLEGIQENFPLVYLTDFPSEGTVAAAETLPNPTWDLNLHSFYPPGAVKIKYSKRRVLEMVNAACSSEGFDDYARKMSVRLRMYQFKFAVATVHEMGHAFVTYLNRCNMTYQARTPTSVTFLDYHLTRNKAMDVNTPWEAFIVPSISGESGRWLEAEIFGGVIECFVEITTPLEDMVGEPGIPYLINAENMSRQIEAGCMFGMVTRLDHFDDFPLTTTGPSFTYEERSEHLFGL